MCLFQERLGGTRAVVQHRVSCHLRWVFQPNFLLRSLARRQVRATRVEDPDGVLGLWPGSELHVVVFGRDWASTWKIPISLILILLHHFSKLKKKKKNTSFEKDIKYRTQGPKLLTPFYNVWRDRRTAFNFLNKFRKMAFCLQIIVPCDLRTLSYLNTLIFKWTKNNHLYI